MESEPLNLVFNLLQDTNDLKIAQSPKKKMSTDDTDFCRVSMNNNNAGGNNLGSTNNTLNPNNNQMSLFNFDSPPQEKNSIGHISEEDSVDSNDQSDNTKNHRVSHKFDEFRDYIKEQENEEKSSDNNRECRTTSFKENQEGTGEEASPNEFNSQSPSLPHLRQSRESNAVTIIGEEKPSF